LAVLLLHANEIVSRDRLIEALWPDRAPGTAGHSLDVQVSRLRKTFASEEILLTRGGGYILEVDSDAIDAVRFERLLEEGRRANADGEPKIALEVLETAAGLWRGEALGDLAYEEFARTEAERLEELRLVATEERIEAELALGHHDRLIPELEALTARHSLRERPRGQLMLALYRSGRQADALRVYADTRTRLVTELGIEPSSQLRELEQAILRQDPALDLPRRAVSTKRRRMALSGLAFGLAGLAVAGVVLVAQGGAESAQALAEPDSNVFVAADTGRVLGAAPVRDTVRVAYGAGALWSVSSTGELTRLDAETGEETARIGLGLEPSGLAAGEGSVWVADRNSPTLVRVDPSVTVEVDRYRLPTAGLGTHLTGEVAVGAGSVWVGHGGFNPGAFVERLDAETGRVQHRYSILGGDVDHLAFAEGALWVASTPSGEFRKIDPETDDVVFMRQLEAQLCCVAAGDGFAWAATNPQGKVWKVAASGTIVGTIELGSPVQSLAFADGFLWASLGEEGTVGRIDPTTDEIREYELGHFVTSADAHDGVLAAGVRHSIADVAGELSGDVVRVGRKGDELFDSGAPVDPAFTLPTWDGPQEMFHYTTCARLLNYPDAGGDEGRTIVPEVAESLPDVSNGGRTFTFRIREGFGFSPPSKEEVTAESFRHAIERAVALTRLFEDELRPPLTNILGAQEYHAGKARHIAGVSAEGDELVIRFREPQPDLPWLVATSSCAVPVDTPVVKGGLEKPVASAGPYYLATLTDSLAVLRRNPNYGGSRPQHVDAIVVELNVSPAEAATRIEEGNLDYFLESQQASLMPDTQAARRAGGRYRLTSVTYPNVKFLALNDDRPLFADPRTRRAVQYALDRRGLVETLPAGSAGIPATRLLASGVPGYEPRQLYPLRGDVRLARELVAGRKARVRVYTWDDPASASFNDALRRQLAAIGLRMTIVPMTQRDFGTSAIYEKAVGSDLIWGGLSANTGDPAGYLRGLFLPPAESRELRRSQLLLSPERERAAIALARRIDQMALFAVYSSDAMPELSSRRLGCIVHQPQYMGVDLAALCLKDSED
jgi:DNA-binding SARP family transcriptional activator/ABC-type transport system substrate-binding protein/streptogramin lyase